MLQAAGVIMTGFGIYLFKPYIRDYFLKAIKEIENNKTSELKQAITYVQDEGCVDAIAIELGENIIGVGAVVIALAVLEVGAIMAAVVLSKKNEKV
ncbi:unnamed protein product [Hydatigera taeniaeformis]|uniref:DUF2tn domain-containing protein n=1 Tax=Hydatigena taeniaeformis TaxID=6205 RepID=A0A0R3WMK5_HYDTA|nr:unnamed protein product [Hydatigera taeniaeformis]